MVTELLYQGEKIKHKGYNDSTFKKTTKKMAAKGKIWS